MESIAHTSGASTVPTGATVPETAVSRARRWETPPAGSPVRLRLDLQRRAHDNLRRHVVRAATRFGVLALADLASFGLMRALIRAVRDDAVVGGWIAGEIQAWTPRGILNGWQYAAALFVALVVLGCYGAGDRRRDARRLFAASALATALPLWTTIWVSGLEVAVPQYAITTLLVWLGLVADRFTVDRLVAWVRPPEATAARTLFVGTAKQCAQAAAGPAFRDRREFISVGFVDVDLPPAAESRGHVVEIARALHDSGAETVVLSGYLPSGLFHTVVEATLAAGCQLLSVPRATAIAGVHPTTVWRQGQAVVELTRPALKGRQLFLKRLVDLTGSLVGLVFLAPVFALVWAAIRLESQGSVIFGHHRVGLNGRVFHCLKFRSMHVDAEARLRGDGALYEEYIENNYKLPAERDPRLTRVGRFLRRTSLDELPQLINVLRGQMSLVGPRPIVPEELDRYGHGAAAFLSLKPGITGAWQVNGRSGVGYPDRADMELEYVRNWSLVRDLAILARTVPVVVGRRGAH